MIAEFEICQRVIRDLRDYGIVVSIDDFGAGVTSLAYLRDLAVQELKLDRSFISRVTEGHPGSRSRCRSINHRTRACLGSADRR